MSKLLTLILLLMAFPAQATTPIGIPIVSIQSATAEASHVLKASPGQLYGFSATSGASAGYVLFFDAVSAPANGTVTPKLCYSLGATGTTGASWLQYPIPFNTGIVVEFSTTGCYTATSSATAFFNAQVQ